jgi:hypothetical protein
MQKNDEFRGGVIGGMEERLEKFKREYEKRMKGEMEAELVRMREFEVSNVRLEEAEKFRVKMEKYREEVDRGYMEKLGRLKERERETIERCK